MTLFFPRDATHYKKDGRTKEKKQATEGMKRMGNESKKESKDCTHCFYGMNGVGKQTNSIVCSIKCGVIQRAVDGKGIGRRVIDNPSTRSSKEKSEAAPICCTTLLTAESLLEELKVW